MFKYFREPLYIKRIDKNLSNLEYSKSYKVKTGINFQKCR